MRSISEVLYVVLTFYSTASYKTLGKWLLSLIVAELYSAVYVQKGMEMCNSATFDTACINQSSWRFRHIQSAENQPIFCREFLFMIFINFKLSIYRRYILSSGNSHLLTAIRSMWFKVPSKDFRALTCSLLSVNILFQCPSLSCHIFSFVYPLTFLLKGKVYLKHA